MKQLSLMILAVLAVAVTGCHRWILPVEPDGGTGNGKHTSNMSFETLSIGQHCGPGGPDLRDHPSRFKVNQKGQIVIDNESDLRELWAEIHLGMFPQPDVPVVDFSKSTVVGLFMGLRSTGGYGIEAKQVTESDKAITISYNESHPQVNCMVTMVITSPYHLIKMDRPSKPLEYAGSPIAIPCE